MGLGWTHLFDWSVASVSDPVEFYHHSHRLQVVAYQVVVQYNYHGMRTVSFPVGDYGLFVATNRQAYAEAMQFCDKMRKKILQKRR